MILMYAGAQWLVRTFHEVRSLLYGRADQRLQRRVSVRLLKHILDLPLRFHLDRETGSVMQTLNSGLIGCRMVVQHLMLSVLPVLVEITTITIVFVSLGQPVFLSIIYGMLICYAAVFSIAAVRLGRAARIASASQIDAGGLLTDSVLNYEPIKAYNAEKAIRRRFDAALARTEADWRRFYVTKLNDGIVAGTVFAVALGCSLLIAARSVNRGTLSVGEFVLVQTYLLQLVTSFELIGVTVRDMSQGFAFLRRMHDLFAERPEEPPDSRSHRPRSSYVTGELCLDSVSFSYHKATTALSDVSFSVPAGSQVAIVGPSGSGKSSLVRLILRFCDPDSGRIMLDNVPIADISRREVRSYIGLVSQDAMLFNESIAFNIAIGKPGSSSEQVIAAAKAACLHEFVLTQTHGYATRIGERGLRLSGGERQRIAIARAFLKCPRILVLDEATSSLDPITERKICQRLRGVLQNVTTIIVAHRLSTVVDADDIVVLDKGRIVEHDTHSKLLDADGMYASMWCAQQRAIDTATSQRP